MRLGLLLLLSGCDWLFGLNEVAVPDANSNDVPDFVMRCPMDDNPALAGSARCIAPDAQAMCGVNCPSATTGRFGGAYKLTGTESFALAPTSLIDGASGYTVSVWILPASPTIDMSFVTKDVSDGAVANAFNFILLAPNGRVEFETTHSGAADYVGAVAPINLNDGAWHHVAATLERTTPTPTKRLYVDGVLAGTRQVPVDDAARLIWIGVDHDALAPVNFYVGGLDELRIYARPLTDHEIGLLAR